jgi:iron(III) transport system ATP-binding protein
VEYEIETAVGELFVVEHSGRDPIAPHTAVRIGLGQRGVSVIPPEA